MLSKVRNLVLDYPYEFSYTKDNIKKAHQVLETPDRPTCSQRLSTEVSAMNLSKVSSSAPSRQSSRSKPTLEQIYAAYGCSPWSANLTKHLIQAQAEESRVAGVTEIFQHMDRGAA